MEGQLNLYALIHVKTYSPLLYQLAIKYLQLLYARAPFFSRIDFPTLLEEIVRQQKNYVRTKGVIAPLSALSFQTAELQAIYYKILHGTSPYSLYPREGYPPLSLCICFVEGKKAMNFSFASEEFLTLLFGVGVSQAIKNREQTKSKNRPYSKLRREDLEQLVKEEDREKIALFDFCYQTKSWQSIANTDKVSKITVTIK